MRIIEVALYSFNELDEKAKKKAIEQFRDINTNYEWWDFLYEQFSLLAGQMGVEVDLKQTYFTGFYSQSDGSAFTGEAEFFHLYRSLLHKNWTTDFPHVTVPFTIPEISPHLLKLIEKGCINIGVKITTGRRNCISVDLDIRLNGNNDRRLANIDNALDHVEAFVTHVCNWLNDHLYKMLEEAYEDLTSDEAISESIVNNSYEFLQNGTFAAAYLKAS